jgi:hypothetical protein
MQTRLCFGTHQSRTTDDLRPRLEPILLVRGDCTFAARNVSRRNCLEQPGDDIQLKNGRLSPPNVSRRNCLEQPGDLPVGA